MSKKILLIGCNGQVGTELQQILAPHHTLTAVTRPTIDLAQPDTLVQIIQTIQPDIIINAAAYTAVNQAESEPEIAKTINVTAPQIIAQESVKVGAFLIHLSTDYVFDGKTSYPYPETNITNPLNIYGQTKLGGELAIKAVTPDYLIIRTAWVYGRFGKSNFVKTMLRLGKERSEIRVVADQIGSPTLAQDIAEAIALIIPQLNSEIAGTYHYTNSGVASWYDLAVAIFEEAQHMSFPMKLPKVIPINTCEYPTSAHRPSYSVLACGKISKVLGNHPPHWRPRLRLMLQEWLTNSSSK